MKNLPLDPHTELFRWGPAPIRIFYISDFLEGIFHKPYFQTSFPGELWPISLTLSKDKRVVFVNEFRDLHKYGGSVFMKYMLPTEAREKVYKSWLGRLSALYEAERNIDATDLESLSDKDFIRLWHYFHVTVASLWTDGTIPELANYGSLPILERELKKTIKDEKEFNHVMEIMTAPEAASFYQEEEMDLAETEYIIVHQQKYFWIKNSYASVETVSIEFFEKRKKEVSPNSRIEFAEKQLQTKERKAECIRKYKLSRDIVDIANAIVAGIEWQDARKKDIWIYLHYKTILVDEVCRRTGYAKEDLLNFREIEVENMLKEKTDLKPVIIERRKAFGFLADKGEINPLTREDADRFWNIYAEEKASDGVTELRGSVASKGNISKITGPIQIVLDPKDADHFREGSILVAPMTTPEYVFIMKRAAAMITDAGGLTSHAAIVSRELGKPCIVGTKIATKVLKDGDMVEVDADHGIIRLLNK